MFEVFFFFLSSCIYSKTLSNYHLFRSLVQLIGNTPMVYLNNIVEGCVARIAAKLESMQPCFSIKDRHGIILQTRARAV